MAVRDGYRWVNVFLCVFVPVEFPLPSTRVPDDIPLGFSFSDVSVPFTVESRCRWRVEFGIIEMAVGIVESVDGYLGLVVNEGPRTIVDEGSVVKVVDSFTEFGVVRGSLGVSVGCRHTLFLSTSSPNSEESRSQLGFSA